MNVLILGDGPEERAWASFLGDHSDHRIVAAYPGFDGGPGPPPAHDFDDALATAGVEAVVVGGGLEVRGEWLRRVAAEGLPAICLHPPGDDSEAYYQVALSREETGAVLVPDLPARLHPGVAAIRPALADGSLGVFRSLRLEAPARPEGGDLTRHAFARAVDLARSLLGEVEAVTATGDPPGEHPDQELVVQLRGPGARRAEVRLGSGAAGPARIVVLGEAGSLTLEVDPALRGPARLVTRSAAGDERLDELEPWDPHAAILGVLSRALEGADEHPNLLDGTRAMELAEAAVRSLRRGRTVDLHYEEISEAGNFKSVMTSTGCVLLMSILLILPVALAGPALGLDWTLYLAYAIPPLLVGFVLLQTLRFAVRDARHPAGDVARSSRLASPSEGPPSDAGHEDRARL